jgi:hypothetical protein
MISICYYRIFLVFECLRIIRIYQYLENKSIGNYFSGKNSFQTIPAQPTFSGLSTLGTVTYHLGVSGEFFNIFFVL